MLCSALRLCRFAQPEARTASSGSATHVVIGDKAVKTGDGSASAPMKNVEVAFFMPALIKRAGASVTENTTTYEDLISA
jgi:hypothetical protein